MSSQSNSPKTGPLRPVVDLPEDLAKLPSIGFVRRPAKSRAEAEQPGILFNMTSLDELVTAAQKYFERNGKVK